MGWPLAPKPVTLYVVPAGSGSPKREDVVTYKMSRFGPPNAAEVICLQGNLISNKTLPVLRKKSKKYTKKLFTHTIK